MTDKEKSSVRRYSLQRNTIFVTIAAMTAIEHKKIRKSLGISQELWGDIVGVGRVAVSDWERSKYPIPVAVELLLRELAREPEMLFRLERHRGMRE